MFRRYVAPVLRLFLALFILSLPILLAALAQAAEEGHSLVTLRTLPLTEQPGGKGRAFRIPASAPATLLEARGEKVLVEVRTEKGSTHGWGEASAFFTLDDPALDLPRLLEKARFQIDQNERAVLTAALLSEAVRRDPANVEAWRLLGLTGERLALGTPTARSLANLWGLRFVEVDGGKGLRYDGEAYRRLIALSPAPEIGEEARVRLLTRCGPSAADADLEALRQREKDLGEFVASYPTSPRRLSLLAERSKVLATLAESAFRKDDAEKADRYREAAIEAASEVSSTAAEPARRRNADRLIARLTRSFPRRLDAARPVSSPNGLKAVFVSREGRTFLEVSKADGKPMIQPYEVTGVDPASLAFDPTGSKVAWDDTPSFGRRRTRLLDLAKARLTEPAALAEPEILQSGASGPADRYTTFLGFSPDGQSMLVVFEGFTSDGVRIPRRHFLCDVDGKRMPILVERPFSAPGTVDWTRLSSLTEKLSG